MDTTTTETTTYRVRIAPVIAFDFASRDVYPEYHEPGTYSLTREEAEYLRDEAVHSADILAGETARFGLWMAYRRLDRALAEMGVSMSEGYRRACTAPIDGPARRPARRPVAPEPERPAGTPVFTTDRIPPAKQDAVTAAVEALGATVWWEPNVVPPRGHVYGDVPAYRIVQAIDRAVYM